MPTDRNTPLPFRRHTTRLYWGRRQESARLGERAAGWPADVVVTDQSERVPSTTGRGCASLFGLWGCRRFWPLSAVACRWCVGGAFLPDGWHEAGGRVCGLGAQHRAAVRVGVGADRGRRPRQAVGSSAVAG